MEEQLENKPIRSLLPVLFAFFVMGFVDVVSISTSYVKKDFGLSDTLANLLPMLVFVWFAVCSLPAGLLAGRIGRKKTVLLSVLITLVAMLLPCISYTFVSVWIAFAVLGIGTTVLQVSLNPLLLDVVSSQKVTSMLTLGQFIKAISSTLGPVIVSAAVGMSGDWKGMFLIYAILAGISWIWLFATPIKEYGKDLVRSSLGRILRLFKNIKLVLAFSVILLSVGFEIGLMTAVPKYLLERCEVPIDQGGLGCSLYFLARMIGTFVGAILLARLSSRRFFRANMIAALFVFILFMATSNVTILLAVLFLIGLFCANIFPITFSMAIQSEPSKANEISALMIMGVAGGAILPLFMGIVADASDQWYSLFIPLVSLTYILIVSFRIR